MRKTDKKIDNQLRVLLTDVCESALEEVNGFEWLTHVVNYDDFPRSLKIICVFDTNTNLSDYLHAETKTYFHTSIKTALDKVDIKLKNLANHILFDTEENCDKQHNGNWAMRLG